MEILQENDRLRICIDVAYVSHWKAKSAWQPSQEGLLMSVSYAYPPEKENHVKTRLTMAVDPCAKKRVRTCCDEMGKRPVIRGHRLTSLEGLSLSMIMYNVVPCTA